jgi:hypothetical protein
MKSVADWIRVRTPDWTDQQRYRWLSTFHAWILPAILVCGFFVQSWGVRFLILIVQIVTIVTEFYFRDCLITMIEKEFSKQSWDDVVTRAFKNAGWPMTRGEKMTFNIGINAGVLITFLIMLMRESVLWIVPIVLLGFSALPILAWFARETPTPSIVSVDLRPQPSS